MSLVELRLSPHPAHVRTARLLAAALGRRRGIAPDRIDEVKLAVGEACARAVRLHQRDAPRTFVVIRIDDGDGLVVEVIDAGHGDSPAAAESTALSPEPGEWDLPGEMSLGLVQGLVEDLEVAAVPGGPGTRVRMRWPAASHRPAEPAADTGS